jgi:hypothetical protein
MRQSRSPAACFAGLHKVVMLCFFKQFRVVYMLLCCSMLLAEDCLAGCLVDWLATD